LAFDDPIVWIILVAFVFIIVFGIYYVARLLYKANKIADLKLKEMQQEKTGSNQRKKEETH